MNFYDNPYEMVREFELPDVGEGLTEAEIVRWLVESGDTVSEDQPVAEVETDKAVVEVPSPVDGTVREILAEEGEVVSVGTVIITFDVEGDAPEAETGPADTDIDTDTDAVSAASERAEPTGDGRVFASPSVRRLAREKGIDLSSLEGSAPGGRVTEADVEAAAEGGPQAGEAANAGTGVTTEEAEGPGSAAQRERDAVTADQESTGVGGEADRDRTLATPATRGIARELDVDIDAVPTDETRDGEALVTPERVRAYAEAREAEAEVAVEAEAGAEPETADRLPYRGVRRTIGERMERSKYTAPHVTHHDEADVTQLVRARSRLKERASDRGVKLSYLPFVMKAVVAGLREHPIVNSRLDEDAEEIVLRDEYNVGVATATDAGLMVPVVENVDRRGVLELASRTNELVEKARERSIAPEEMQGGTFTITNFGSIGGEYATPIVNYPETAILGLGSIEKKPRVVDDGSEGSPSVAPDGSVPGEVVPRYVLPLSLSIDHRVIDGADAARFVNTVVEYLEDPELLLLE